MLVPVFDEIVPSGGQNDWSITDLDDVFTDLDCEHLKLIYSARTEDGAAYQRLLMRFNGDTASNYAWALSYAGSGGEGAASDTSDPFIQVGYAPGGGSDANYSAVGEILIPDFASTAYDKVARINAGMRFSTHIEAYDFLGWWNNTAALTDILIYPENGQLEEGSRLTVYGLKTVAPDNQKISGLTALTSLDGTEEFVVNDSGTSKKITAADLIAGQEIAYAQITSDVTLASTTEGSPTNVISAGAVTFDGSTRVCIEFHSYALSGASGGAAVLNLWDDTTTDLGRLGAVSSNIDAPCLVRRFLTPSAASHTYRVRGWCTGGSGNGVAHAGAGGAAATMPAYIRITRA